MPIIRRSRAALLAAAALAAAALLALASTARAESPIVHANRLLLGILRTPGAQPASVHATRSMALLHVAQYDAVVAIDRRRRQFGTRLHAPRRADRTAAAVVAGHDVLVALYPAQRGMLDGDESAALARLRDGRRRRRGEAVGARAAAAVLALRAHDAAQAAAPAYATTGAPGDYAPTPPAFAAPVLTQWGAVKPWVLRSGHQFRPPPPPALDSPAWASAYDEVRALGSQTSATRTADETQQAQFWAGPIQNVWNDIADEVADARHPSLDDSAQAFATLELALADSTVALYDAKYAYRFWRPITAIRAGDTDQNAATVADGSWTPLAATPPDPSYPGAHSTLSTAAATVLARAFGARTPLTVSTDTLPGVSRSFGSFAEAATEAGLSRIYAGVHTRLDHTAGVRLGRAVARYVLAHAL